MPHIMSLSLPSSVFHLPALRQAAHLLLAGLVTLCTLQPAHAQLFGDNEARRAILDLRQRYQALSDDNAKTRSSLLELQTQIETLRADLAKARGREEQLTRDVAELQRRQRDLVRSVESTGHTQAAGAGATTASTGDDAPPVADSNRDKAEFEAALNQFRNGDYAKAQTGFRNLLKNHPQSSQKVAALFWLGNSDYALRNYRSALTNFRAVVNQAPDHERAPEALLSIANCQMELKDTAAARAALEQLVTRYPRSEAAQAGKDRLARLK